MTLNLSTRSFGNAHRFDKHNGEDLQVMFFRDRLTNSRCHFVHIRVSALAGDFLNDDKFFPAFIGD